MKVSPLWLPSTALAGLMAVAVAPASAAEVSLFTTQEDFTGWGDASSLTVVQATPDYDGSSTNGLAEGGGAGTPGSLGIGPSSNFQYFFSEGQQDNAALISALGTGGDLLFDHEIPPAVSTAYFELGFVMNYNGHFDQYFGSTVDNLDGSYTTTIPYEFSPGDLPDDGSYLQLGIIYNAGGSGVLVSIDNLRVNAVPEPVSATLAALGLGFVAVGARQRSRR